MSNITLEVFKFNLSAFLKTAGKTLLNINLDSPVFLRKAGLPLNNAELSGHFNIVDNRPEDGKINSTRKIKRYLWRNE